MDIIITALGEFVWATSCAVVNFCLSSGLSVLTVFVSVLCAILASAFYKYTSSREQMSLDDTTCTLVNQDNDDLDKPITITSITEPLIMSTLPSTTTDEPVNNECIQSLSEIEIFIQENPNENESEGEENINENETGNEENMNRNGTDYEDNAIEDEANNEEIANDFLIDTVEGTEEEIQKKQIANIYRLLNDQNLINNWTTTDFLDQLKMYGLQEYDENELELS